MIRLKNRIKQIKRGRVLHSNLPPNLTTKPNKLPNGIERSNHKFLFFLRQAYSSSASRWSSDPLRPVLE